MPEAGEDVIEAPGTYLGYALGEGRYMRFYDANDEDAENLSSWEIVDSNGNPLIEDPADENEDQFYDEISV